jgi:cell wall assembly regulator SMI1
MTDLTHECDNILKELSKFSADLLYLGPRITDTRMESFEKQIGYQLPLDFKYLLKKHNGISLFGVEILGLDEALRGSSLDEVYKSEHFEVYNKMPGMLLPFSPDGYGNHYCLDLSKLDAGFCPVIFWQHDISYSDDEQPEVCNANLLEWIQEVMIDWTLADYNYDGTEK